MNGVFTSAVLERGPSLCGAGAGAGVGVSATSQSEHASHNAALIGAMQVAASGRQGLKGGHALEP